jgi:hypothetical protein
LNILFICDSIAPGRSGIGDYAVLLAKACVERQHTCSLIAVNDTFLPNTDEYKEAVMHELPVLRIKSFDYLNKYQQQISQWISKQSPDWISFQFTPYVCSAKGLLSLSFLKFIKMLPASSRHIMAHEIWIAGHREATFKNKILGFLQKISMFINMRYYKPDLIHTHAQVYVQDLQRYGFKVKPLMLFGNLPIDNPLKAVDFYECMAQHSIPVTEQNRTSFWILGTFGSLYKGFEYESFLKDLFQSAKTNKKQVVLLILGNLNETETVSDHMQALYPENCFRLKGLSDLILTLVLQNLDFGIVATPYAVVQKSGSIALMTSLGTPVLVPRDDISFVGIDHYAIDNGPLVHKVDSLLWKRIHTIQRSLPKDKLPIVRDQFLRELEAVFKYKPLS